MKLQVNDKTFFYYFTKKRLCLCFFCLETFTKSIILFILIDFFVLSTVCVDIIIQQIVEIIYFFLRKILKRLESRVCILSKFL